MQTAKFNMYKTKIFGSLVLTVMALLFCTSCSKSSDNDNLDEVIERLWNFAQKNPDGFTIDIRTFQAPKEGIVVSYAATQNSFDKKDLRKVISHAYFHANLVGGWLNDENKKYYFDSDTIFMESMLKEALEWGKKNNQQSVFILSEMKSIDIK